LLWLVGGTAGLWLILAGSVSLFRDDQWLPSAAAAGLCLVPTLATLGLTYVAARRSPEERAMAVLAGVILRLGTVMIGGLFLYPAVPELAASPIRFWAWVLVFYLATLAGETALILLRADDSPSGPPAPLGR
jgi:hypothetical protein